MMDPKATGNLLREIRESRNLTQREVGEYLRITVQTVSNWETGRRRLTLTPRQIVQLCELFNCSVETLADWLDGVKELPK